MKQTRILPHQPSDDLIDRIPIGVYQADVNGIVTYCNPWAARILGYVHVDELIGVDLNTLYVNPKDRERLLGSLSASSVSDNYRIELCKHTGETIVISVNTRHRNPGDPGSGVEGAFTDVTALANYEQLFEGLPVGVYQLDPEQNIIRCNRGFERVFGYERGELNGKPAAVLYKDLHEMKRLADDLKCRKDSVQPEVKSRVIEMQRKDRTSVWISLTTHLRLNRGGQVIGREGALIEVTLHEATERKLINGYCYIALPFQDFFRSLYKKNIKPTAAKHKYIAQTADAVIATRKTMRTKMCDMMRDARFVIGDVTGENPNVMYELGLAHAYGKHVIVISQNDEVPVNIREFEFIRYENSIDGADMLGQNLSKAIEHVHEALTRLHKDCE